MNLKKVWRSVWSRSNRCKDTTKAIQVPLSSSSSSISAFDQVPMGYISPDTDVGGAKRRIEIEPSEWDSIFFAETSLRDGYPLRHFLPSRFSSRYLFSIFLGHTFCDQEAEEGACRSKASTKNPNKPKSPASQCLLHFHVIIAYILFNLVHVLTLVYIYIYMQVKPHMQPIVVSLPLCHFDDTESAKTSRRQLKTAILNVLFYMNVPAVCAVNQASLYSLSSAFL
ncbi:unnamed protein product [Brassica oleracea]